MELIGTIRGGVVVLEPGAPIVEGQTVRVVLSEPVDGIDDLPGFGLWKDRTDLGDTETFVHNTRRSMERRET